jgi:hypothetical protein
MNKQLEPLCEMLPIFDYPLEGSIKKVTVKKAEVIPARKLKTERKMLNMLTKEMHLDFVKYYKNGQACFVRTIEPCGIIEFDSIEECFDTFLQGELV